MTFQDDWVALKLVDMLNPRRLMWANDFPHSDSTWPWSRELLLGQTQHLTEQQKAWIAKDLAAAPRGATRIFALHFLPTREQVEYMKAIRAGTPINNGDYMARSTLFAIMGQISCYTGKEVTWEQITQSDFAYAPKPEECHDGIQI